MEDSSINTKHYCITQTTFKENSNHRFYHCVKVDHNAPIVFYGVKVGRVNILPYKNSNKFAKKFSTQWSTVDI